MIQREAEANQFGYSFRPLLKLAKLSPSAIQSVRLPTTSPVQQLGVSSLHGRGREGTVQ